MAKASIWLKAFDREREFVAGKPMRVSGHDFLPGDPFDKSLVSTRRLRQLYEMRKVKMVDPSELPPPVDIPADWRSKSFLALKALAQKINPRLDKKAKKDAVLAVIEAEVGRRG